MGLAGGCRGGRAAPPSAQAPRYVWGVSPPPRRTGGGCHPRIEALGKGTSPAAASRTAPPPRSAARCCGSSHRELDAGAGFCLPCLLHSLSPSLSLPNFIAVIISRLSSPGRGQTPQTSRLFIKRFPAGQCQRRRSSCPPAPPGPG